MTIQVLERGMLIPYKYENVTHIVILDDFGICLKLWIGDEIWPMELSREWVETIRIEKL